LKEGNFSANPGGKIHKLSAMHLHSALKTKRKYDFPNQSQQIIWVFCERSVPKEALEQKIYNGGDYVNKYKMHDFSYF